MAETKKETMMTPITIRVDMALKNRLADLAGQDGRELSSYVRRVMQLHVAAVDRAAKRKPGKQPANLYGPAGS